MHTISPSDRAEQITTAQRAPFQAWEGAWQDPFSRDAAGEGHGAGKIKHPQKAELCKLREQRTLMKAVACRGAGTAVAAERAWDALRWGRVPDMAARIELSMIPLQHLCEVKITAHNLENDESACLVF